MTDVSTHFRIPILSGQSAFTVRVPHHYLQGQRQFFFSQLHLVPDYFSLDAEKQKLDADPELEQMVEMNVQVKINHGDPKTIYSKDPFVNSATTTKTIDAIQAINAYFQDKKPEFAYTSPLFIDWVDITQANKPIEEYVPKMAKIYYGKEYNATEHLDFLPDSVRSLEYVNNYLPPLGTLKSLDAFNERIRLRLWLAPFTRAVFSSKEPFASDFGFTEAQLGKPQQKQYHLINDKPYYLPVIIAETAPVLDLTRVSFKLNVGSSRSTIDGQIKGIQMLKKDWFDNEKLAETLSAKFLQTSRMTNTDFSFGYNKTDKKFFFKLPDSDKIGVVLRCDPEFAHRLGFGSESLIMHGMKAAPQEERLNISDAKKKALSVVFDTGPILCTLDQMSSNTTSGALDHYMAALYPHESGILSMPQSVCSCTSNLTPIHALTQASAANVPVTFRLLRIYEDQSISDFAWKCNAYIYGVLQGICKKV